MRAKFKAMMKYWKIFSLLAVLFTVISCNNDDDGTSVELRDETEVYLENEEAIEEYLNTHYFELVPAPGSNPLEQEILIGAIEGENADRTSIMESDELKLKEIVQNGITYKLYYLQLREGSPEAYQPTKADRVIVTYEVSNLAGNIFEDINTPYSFYLLTNEGPGLIPGFTETLIEFRGASGFEENSDGSINYADDFGMGVVFIPPD